MQLSLDHAGIRRGCHFGVIAVCLSLCLTCLGWSQAGSSGTGSSGSGSSGSTTSPSSSTSGQPDWSSVTSILGQAGRVQSDGVLKYSIDRNEIQINLKDKAVGAQVDPALVLDGFISFEMVGSSATPAGGATTGASSTGTAGAGTNVAVTAELPLKETEVETVIDTLQRGGIEVSGLHNHLIQENPRAIFLHVESVGDAATMATAFRSALGSTSMSMSQLQTPQNQSQRNSVQGLNTQQIQGAFANAKVSASSSNVLDVEVPRAEQFTACIVPFAMGTMGSSGTSGSSGSNSGSSGTNGTGTSGSGGSNGSTGTSGTGTTGTMSAACPTTASGATGPTSTTAGLGTTFPLTSDMGAEHEFHMQTLGSSQVVVAAEFALLENEVNQAVMTLRQAGFDVTAVHNHFIGESQRLIFVHASNKGDINTILGTLQSVLVNTGQGTSGSQP